MKLFKVNLQNGFVIDETDTIIGAYSHHNKAIVFKVPSYDMKGKQLPEEINDYKKIYGFTDSFSISCWTSKGDKNIYDVVQMAADLKTS